MSKECMYDRTGCHHEWADTNTYMDNNILIYTYQKCNVCAATRTVYANGDFIIGTFVTMGDLLALRELTHDD
jgi:hypothetical protein